MSLAQTTAQAEVDRNYEAFVGLLPSLMSTHANKWALLHDGELTAVFDTARDAHLAGVRLYAEARYSVQEVTNRPVDLGWFSHAVPSDVPGPAKQLPTTEGSSVPL